MISESSAPSPLVPTLGNDAVQPGGPGPCEPPARYPRKKPRCKLENLTPDERQLLVDWLAYDGLSLAGAAFEVERQFGVTVSNRVMREFYQQQVVPLQIAEEAAEAETVAALADGPFEEAMIRCAKRHAFSALSRSEPDVKKATAMFKFIAQAERSALAKERSALARERLELEKRRVAVLEATLALARTRPAEKQARSAVQQNARDISERAFCSAPITPITPIPPMIPIRPEPSSGPPESPEPARCEPAEPVETAPHAASKNAHYPLPATRYFSPSDLSSVLSAVGSAKAEASAKEDLSAVGSAKEEASAKEALSNSRQPSAPSSESSAFRTLNSQPSTIPIPPRST